MVEADVSGILPVGGRYEIRNAQDYYGPPVVSATYDGRPLRLPMTGLTVAKPVGVATAPAATAPRFNVFVLVRR